MMFTDDSMGCLVPVLLGLTEAFDTVGHAVLLEQLEHCVGVRGAFQCLLFIYLYGQQIASFQMLHPSHVEFHKVQG